MVYKLYNWLKNKEVNSSNLIPPPHKCKRLINTLSYLFGKTDAINILCYAMLTIDLYVGFS